MQDLSIGIPLDHNIRSGDLNGAPEGSDSSPNPSDVADLHFCGGAYGGVGEETEVVRASTACEVR